MTTKHETQRENIAADFDLIVEEMPEEYNRLVAAMYRHANAEPGKGTERASRELAVILLHSPKALIHCLSENLAQVNHPRDPETNALIKPYTDIPGIRPEVAKIFKTGMFFTDIQGRENGLDETFWQAVLSDCFEEIMDDRNINIDAGPISIHVDKIRFSNGIAIIRMTANTTNEAKQHTVGQAVVFEAT